MKKRDIAYECQCCGRTIPFQPLEDYCTKCGDYSIFNKVEVTVDKNGIPCPEIYSIDYEEV